MKNIIVSCLFFISSFCKAETEIVVSTFNGQSVHYGWSGDSFSETDLHRFLSENFSSTPKLDLQKKLDEKSIKVELLWKISGSIAEVTKVTKSNTSSWIWASAKPDSFKVMLQSDGVGLIHLYQKKDIVGQFRCHTSANRNANTYNQLKPDNYKITEKKLRHVSTEKGLKGSVLKLAMNSGVDGKWFHEGEFAPSHGCIRVCKPAMMQFYSLIDIDTPFTVVWDELRG